MTALSVYITAASREDALAIGRAVVRERLAACANVIDGLTSIYWWQGRMMEEGEAALILKTTEAAMPALLLRVKQLHSYDCPCVVAHPLTHGNPDFLDWIAAETGAAPAQGS